MLGIPGLGTPYFRITLVLAGKLVVDAVMAGLTSVEDSPICNSVELSDDSFGFTAAYLRNTSFMQNCLVKICIILRLYPVL